MRVTRYQALSAEIEMLDQDLLSQPPLLDLLKIKRDREAASVEWVGARVKALEDLLNRKRTAEAERTKVRAEARRREAVGRHPLVADLAQHNEKLSVELASTTNQLAGLTADQERTDRLARAIDYDFQGAREIVAIGSLRAVGRNRR